ncbi:MAG: hypothetical protein GX442_24100 [Candidatus Riflebacteria bacterium]|nr:hypothetical protein [Candidatus Riflebacteria bacterium]
MSHPHRLVSVLIGLMLVAGATFGADPVDDLMNSSSGTEASSATAIASPSGTVSSSGTSDIGDGLTPAERGNAMRELAAVYETLTDEQKASLFTNTLRMFNRDRVFFLRLCATGRFAHARNIIEKWLGILSSQMGKDFFASLGYGAEDVRKALEEAYTLLNSQANGDDTASSATSIMASATIMLYQEELGIYEAEKAAAEAATPGSLEQFNHLQAMGDLAFRWMTITTRDATAAKALKSLGYTMPADARNALDTAIKTQVDQILTDAAAQTLTGQVLDDFEAWAKKNPYVVNFCVKTYGAGFWAKFDALQSSLREGSSN